MEIGSEVRLLELSDVSERLVEEANLSDGRDGLPAPEHGEAPRIASPDLEQSNTVPSSPSRSLLSRLSNLVGGGRFENVTARTPMASSTHALSPVQESPRSPRLTQLEQLRLDTELAELTSRRTSAQLEQLRLEVEMAELAVRRASADRTAAEHRLATRELEGGISAHGSPRSHHSAGRDRGADSTGHPPSRSPSPPASAGQHEAMIAALIRHMEDSRRADSRALEEARREDLLVREAERRALEEARRTDHLVWEAERRADRAEAEARWAALANDRRPATRHVIGVALRDLAAFEGKPNQDISEFLAEFLRLTSAHQVPLAFLSNELIIKLQGNAAKWFQTAFPRTPGDKDVCPQWNDLQAAIIHHFTRRYTAAKAWSDLNGARRLPGTTGPEAVQRIAEMSLALSLKGVPLTVGPNERLAYIYQNQLTEEEFGRWSAAANAHVEVSDAALAALESADATDRGTTSRLSCSVETRERWFLGRVEHLRCFLNDQAKAPGGLGSSVRAAVTTADDGTDGTVVAAAATTTSPGTPGSRRHRHKCPW